MKTMKRFFMLLLIMVAAMSAQTLYAQTNGDVNGDGNVNEADISAIIEIMKEANGVSGPKKYYWYVGQENPASIDTSNLKEASNEAGWHLIGTSTSGFTLTFNNQNYIEFDEKTQYYLTIPNLLSVYAADGSTPVEDKYFLTTEQKITGYKTLLYNTSVWEVKGLVIK